MAVLFAQVVIITTCTTCVYTNNDKNTALKAPTGDAYTNIDNKIHLKEDEDKCDRSSLVR